MESRTSVTELLQRWGRGDRAALDELVPLVSAELRELAGTFLRRERANHTLVATALVNEAFLRLVDQRAGFQNRAQFVGVAAAMMRRVLVDHARARAAAKRPHHALQVTLEPSVAPSPDNVLDVVALDEALRQLAELDERQAKIVELRYFGGLTNEEAAEVLGLSERTVKRDWTTAKAWLFRHLQLDR
jgi:RNA polymerase sigma factor (TIGR02999 family)